jgi:hypothetical protein
MPRAPRSPRLRQDIERVLGAVDTSSAPRREQPALVVLIGLPATGKSRIAEALRARTGAAVLESDALRRLLFRRRTYSPLESRRLFAALHGAADRLLRRGVSVILDATNLVEAERRPLYRLAERRGAKLLLVHVTAPHAAARRRLKRRRAAGEGASEADLEVYERMAARAQPIERPHYVLDTTRNVDRMLRVISKDMVDT